MIRKAHNRKIMTRAVLAVILTMAVVSLQLSLTQVSATVVPVVVNKGHLGFGTVFPGEEHTGDFTVSYAEEEGDAAYRIVQKRKPLPPEHPDYPDGGDPDLPGYYRDLCPYLEKISFEGEGDSESAATVGPEDAADKWTVYFRVPAIVGYAAQDHSGGLVTTNGEYGCDISIEVEENGGPATYCGDGIKQSPNGALTGGPANDGYEDCDQADGTPAGYYCAADCTLAPVSNGGGSSFFSSSFGGGLPSGPVASPTPVVLGVEGAPALALVKSVALAADWANPGDINVPYRLVVENRGDLTAFNVVLTDTLPAGLVFSDTRARLRTIAVGDLAPGESAFREYLVDVEAGAAAGRYTNTASARADNHPEVTATAGLEVRATVVQGAELVPTGFSLAELIGLMLLAGLLITAALHLRRKSLQYN